jgi:hypothetical protein
MANSVLEPWFGDVCVFVGGCLAGTVGKHNVYVAI